MKEEGGRPILEVTYQGKKKRFKPEEISAMVRRDAGAGLVWERRIELSCFTRQPVPDPCPSLCFLLDFCFLIVFSGSEQDARDRGVFPRSAREGRRGDRAGLLQRRAATGNQGCRQHQRHERAAHHQQADRGGHRLRTRQQGQGRKRRDEKR